MTEAMNLSSSRINYPNRKLSKSTVFNNPTEQFKKWFYEAENNPNILEPNAMILSTVSNSGQPSSRTVLLKEISPTNAFIFFTSYSSRKSCDIANNNKVSLLFLWLPLARQVRIEGSAHKVDEETSETYFQSRPRQSQLGTWASTQSKSISSRQKLEEQFNHFKSKFKNKQVPKPQTWGGFAITPVLFEFWQGRPNRLHDRILYTQKREKWQITRLAP